MRQIDRDNNSKRWIQTLVLPTGLENKVKKKEKNKVDLERCIQMKEESLEPQEKELLPKEKGQKLKSNKENMMSQVNSM